MISVTTTVVLFTGDLRVHDHPALGEAIRRSDQVVPLFVFDRSILSSDFARPNRIAFLLDCLRDLDNALNDRGGRLFIRTGDVVEETMATTAGASAVAVYASEGASAYARSRERRLADACASAGVRFQLFDGVNVVAPGQVSPAGGDHYRVFTPYWRAWRSVERRSILAAPRMVNVPSGIAPGRLPALSAIARGSISPNLPVGGESAGRKRLTAWLRTGLTHYPDGHDALEANATSRLSPYLHFGCVSPRELERLASGKAGGSEFIRQLCWRDFYHQVLAARSDLPHADLRARRAGWRRDKRLFDAWSRGATGYPIVDAGMRQLRLEGWMHNRARLITASFLTKDLLIDWRLGAAHFWDLLVDGDIANNSGNWQWVAGTGNDTRPHRMFNPIRQAHRFDPDGAYVRRYVPELATIAGGAVHEPWKLDDGTRSRLKYPSPVIDHDEAAREFRRRSAP